jgi:saccharopine dehydrogenase-like NADP-dependent oxidoreductase
MKKILVLGAGQSTPYLIQYLLDHAEEHDWFVTVGDANIDMARRRLQGHSRSAAVLFDATDSEMRHAQIGGADIVVNMLPAAYQMTIALDCVAYRTHMVSASYEDVRVRDLDLDANRHGVLILNECGLDPGIDHMSSMDVIARIRAAGGRVTAFRSYGAGLPAPEFDSNPLRYAITWNPRNVVMSGEGGATYLVDGKTKIVPFHEVFQRSWPVEVEGLGTMEAYPNRDSLYYRKLFGLLDTATMVRATLRYPGWCETWLQIVRLGVPNENMRFPTMSDMTYRDLLEMFLPVHGGNGKLETRIAQFLGVSPTGTIIQNLDWLGLFADTPVPAGAHSVAEAMTRLLVEKLQLGPGDRDMVTIVHDIEAEFPEDGNRRERVTSTMVKYGEVGGHTAMSKTVGLPAGIATRLVITGSLPITGCQIPTHPTVYTPVLKELEELGLGFTERRVAMEGPPDDPPGG